MKTRMTVTIDRNLFNQIETLRGREKRSTFVEHLQRLALNHYLHNERRRRIRDNGVFCLLKSAGLKANAPDAAKPCEGEVSLIGLIALEVDYIIYFRSWNSEVFSAITGLIGTITGMFISQRARKNFSERGV